MTAARGEPAELAQAKAAFLLSLRARGIRDTNLLRALETVPREIFVPQPHQHLARRNLALPLPCGQTLPEPWLAARMIEALQLAGHHRVLEIGAGSGYATALMARIAREVVSIERFQRLAGEAAGRLAQLGFDGASVAWGDGLAIPLEAGPFDRVIVQGALPDAPARLVALLASGGVLVMARADPGEARRQTIMRLTRNDAGGLDADAICACRLQPILAGASRAL